MIAEEFLSLYFVCCHRAYYTGKWYSAIKKFLTILSSLHVQAAPLKYVGFMICHFPKLHFFLIAQWLVWNNQEWKCRAFTIHNLGQTILLCTGYNPIFLQKKSEADFEDVLRLFPWDEIKTLLHHIHIVAIVLLDGILNMDFLLKLTNYVAI